jgi:hypothetical protein
LGHRQVKVFAPEQMVIAPPARADLMRVTIEHRSGGERDVRPERMEARDGRALQRAVVVGDPDTLVIESTHDQPVELQLYARGNGLFERHDFRRVHSVSGGLSRRFPSEVVWFPDDLDQPVRVSMRDLSNPFNNYDFAHGDLLLVRAVVGDSSQHLLFKRRAHGVHVNGFAGLLATVPLTEAQQGVAPVLAVGPTFGPRDR